MIKYYHVQNFKNLWDTEANFEQLNVIIGPNSAGKSSLLQSIDFLKAFMVSSIDYYLATHNIDFKDVINKRLKENVANKKTVSWDITVCLPSGEYRYVVKLYQAKKIEEKLFLIDDSSHEKEIFWRNDRNYGIKSDDDEWTKGGFLNPQSGFLNSITEDEHARYPGLLQFKKFILGIQTFLIWDPDMLRQRSREKQDELGPNGQHLAVVLAEMKRKEGGQFAKMIKRLQKLLPWLEDISVKTIPFGWKEIILHERDEWGTIQLNGHQISDGTLRLIAMAYLRYGNRPYTVMSFEEPENGIHPPVLRAAVQMIQEITQLKPHLRNQVFMTTHSPYLLDILGDYPESIYIMEKGEKVGARLSGISKDKIKLAKLLFNNSIGNMWYSGVLQERGGEQ